MSNPFAIHTPRHVYLGAGEINRIPEILASVCDPKAAILLVTDKGVGTTGIPQNIAGKIKYRGFSVILVDSVPQEPFTEDVDGIVQSLKGTQIGFLVGVGGGSVLDTTKLLSILLHKEGVSVTSLLEEGIAGKGILQLLVPTTAGTGSEATPNAIVAVREKQLKVGIVSGFLVPDYVVLDPLVTLGLPPSLTASTGIDALCHTLECYTSKKANLYSNMVALEGTRLILTSIRRAFENGSDQEARFNMLLGSFYGGLSIASSGTTAVHALSYPLGGKYRIPHGLANAMLLVPVLEYNRDIIEEKLAVIARTVKLNVGSDTSETELSRDFLVYLKDLVRDLRIPSSLSEFGIGQRDLPEISERALQVTRLLSNNPKPVWYEDIVSIYQEIV